MSNVIRPAQNYFTRHTVYDSFRNFLAGLGVVGRDKVASHRFVCDVLSPDELEAAYRADWIARKVVDLPAFDACRAWRAWKADQNQIEKIEEAERAFNLQRKLMHAMARARLYGGAALVIGVKKQPWDQELDVDKVGKGDLVFVHMCTKYNLSAGPMVRDITSPWYGEPEYYERSDSPITTPGLQLKSSEDVRIPTGLQIHPSRVVRLIGQEYPDQDRAMDAWGDSALQPVIDAIKHAGLVVGSVAALVAKASVDIIKVPGLSQALSTNAGTAQMIERWSNANVAKSVVNAVLIDEKEEWQQVTASFASLPQTLQMYLGIVAGAADIPATRLLSKSPDGQNSTGDSDIRNYYDRLSADQVMHMKPLLSRLDEVLLRHTLGTRDPKISYDWNPLWQMDEPQKADVAYKKANAHKIDVDTGLIAPEALRKGRENQLIEDGFYPGFEAALQEAAEAASEDVPDEALPPHPAIRQQLKAQEQFAQQQQIGQQNPKLLPKPTDEEEPDDED